MEGLFLLKAMVFHGTKCERQTWRMYTLQRHCQWNPGSMSDSSGRPYIRVLLHLQRTFSSSSGLYKVIKSPIYLLRKLSVRITIHVDNMILMASSLEDLLMARDTLISILQCFWPISKVLPRANIYFRIVPGDARFWGNDFESSQGGTTQSTESGNPRKGDGNNKENKQTDWEVSIHSNSSCSGTLPLCLSSILICYNSFDEKVTFSMEARKELLWWNKNLTLCKKRSLICAPHQIILISDESLQAWGANCQGLATEGPWSLEERKFHTNFLELKAVKLAIMSSTLKKKEAISIHICMDNMTALSYLKNMGNTKNEKLTAINKEIWQ